jgi:hypothetical protein
MIEIVLVLIVLVGLALIYILIDCAKSLRDSQAVSRQMLETLERELIRQSLLLEAGVSESRFEGRAAFRLEHTRLGTKHPIGFRFAARIHTHSLAGFAIWVFRDSAWHLEENLCQRGFVPGPPPQIAGRFTGDRIRKEGIPQK